MTYLKMGKGQMTWDNSSLQIHHGNMVRLIRLKDHHSILDLNRDLSIAAIRQADGDPDFEGDLDVEVDGMVHTLDPASRFEVLEVTERWFGDYLSKTEENNG